MSSVLDDTTTPRTLLQAVIDNKAVNASAYPSRKRKSISKTPVIRSTRKRAAESETTDQSASNRPVTRYESKRQSERIAPTPGSAHPTKRRRRSSIGSQLNDSSWNTITPRSNIIGFLSQADEETPLAASQVSAWPDDDLPDIPSIKKMDPTVDMSMYEDASVIEKSQNRRYVSRRGKHRDLRQLTTLNEFSKSLQSLPEEYTSTQKETRSRTSKQRKAANELHDFTLSSLDENEETLYLSQMEDETLPSAIVDRNASSSVLPPQYETSAVQGRSGRLNMPTRRSARFTNHQVSENISSDLDGAILKDQVDKRSTLHPVEEDQNQNATVPSNYDELPTDDNERVEDSYSDSDSNQQPDVMKSLRLLEKTDSTSDNSVRSNELLTVSRRQNNRSNREVISEEDHEVSRRQSRRRSSLGQNKVEQYDSEEIVDIYRTRRSSLRREGGEHEVNVNKDDSRRTTSANQNSRRTSSANRIDALERIEQQQESESPTTPNRRQSTRQSSSRHSNVIGDDESESPTTPNRQQSTRQSSSRHSNVIGDDESESPTTHNRRQSTRQSSSRHSNVIGDDESEPASYPNRRQSMRRSSLRLRDGVGEDEGETGMSPRRHQSRGKSSPRLSDGEGEDEGETGMSPRRHQSRGKSSLRHSDGEDEGERGMSPRRHQSRRKSSLRLIDGEGEDEGETGMSPRRHQSRGKSSLRLSDGEDEGETGMSPIRHQSRRKSSLRLIDGEDEGETGMSPRRHQSRRKSSPRHSDGEDESETGMSPLRHQSRGKSSLRLSDGEDEGETGMSPRRHQSRGKSSLRHSDGEDEGEIGMSPLRHQSRGKSSLRLSDGEDEDETGMSPRRHQSRRKSSLRLIDGEGEDEDETGMSPRRHQSRRKSSLRHSDGEDESETGMSPIRHQSRGKSSLRLSDGEDEGETGMSPIRHQSRGKSSLRLSDGEDEGETGMSPIRHQSRGKSSLRLSDGEDEGEIGMSPRMHQSRRKPSLRLSDGVGDDESASESVVTRSHDGRRSVMKHSNVSGANYSQREDDADSTLTQRMHKSFSSNKDEVDPAMQSQQMGRRSSPRKSAVIVSPRSNMESASSSPSVHGKMAIEDIGNLSVQDHISSGNNADMDNDINVHQMQNRTQSIDQTRKSLPSTDHQLTPVVPPREDLSEEEDESSVIYSELNTPHFSRSQRILSSVQKTAERISNKPESAAKIRKSPGPSQAKPKTSRPQKKISTLKIPTSQTRRLFSHFAKMRVSKEAITAVENLCEKYWRHLAIDLEAYAAHANRKTINEDDLELLMKRQGFVTRDQSMYHLVAKFLPLELRQEIIPVARSGNVVVPKN